MTKSSNHHFLSFSFPKRPIGIGPSGIQTDAVDEETANIINHAVTKSNTVKQEPSQHLMATASKATINIFTDMQFIIYSSYGTYAMGSQIKQESQIYKLIICKWVYVFLKEKYVYSHWYLFYYNNNYYLFNYLFCFCLVCGFNCYGKEIIFKKLPSIQQLNPRN